MTQNIISKRKKSNPIISIVTVCLNSEKNLEETILSVLNQTYKKIEYIIIDGGSADNTLSIIKKYENKIDYWISEKDEGIYHAMNKGISVASGEILHFLNAGDVYYSNDVLTTINDIFNKKEDTGIVYGLAESFSEHENLKYINGGEIDKNRLWKGMPICHQSMFFKRDVFRILGGYDLDYSSMADYEFLLRFVNTNHKFKLYYIDDKVLSRFDLYGFSSKDYLKNLKEIETLCKKYYQFNMAKRFYFITGKIKFYFLVILKKTGLHKFYRKIKYKYFYGLFSKKRILNK